jgi:hypothetical protein
LISFTLLPSLLYLGHQPIKPPAGTFRGTKEQKKSYPEFLKERNPENVLKKAFFRRDGDFGAHQ